MTMKFSNFPILIPAFTAQIHIDTPLPITKDLLDIRFLSNTGTLISETDYPHSVHATFIHGSDYLRRDPDGQNVRLDVTSTARDNTGALLRFSYNGVVRMGGDEGKVIRGDKNASTTGFGSIFIQVKFEAESAGLKPLGDKLYVGSGRFIVQEDQPTVVEYKISEVGAGCSD